MRFTEWFEKAYHMTITAYQKEWTERYEEETWPQRLDDLIQQYEIHKAEQRWNPIQG